MKRVAIPTVQAGSAEELVRHAGAVKQNLDMVTGQHRNSTALKPLAATASLAEVIVQMNALLARIQGDA